MTPDEINTLREKAELYDMWECVRFKEGYEQAEKDIIALIESRISEILGDAQPKPILRAELQELIERIKEAKR